MKTKLTMLSFGGGQDSTAILLMLIHDKAFREKYAPGKLIVVMADTRNEHHDTNIHVDKCWDLCDKHDIPFYMVKPLEFASGDWKEGYVSFLEKGDRIGSKCFPKTCTDNLKIKPIYKFLERYVHLYYKTKKEGRKESIKEFASKYGKIDVLIGIARGEEKRASTNEESPHKWMRDSINKVYPLLELGMDRQDCQNYISGTGSIIPPPSNCILCPFMSHQELLYLARYKKEWYLKWVQLEANKIKANSHVENNMGVWGKKLLPEVLKIAEEKYGHMSYEDLVEYKMSHGHCVKSKY